LDKIENLKGVPLYAKDIEEYFTGTRPLYFSFTMRSHGLCAKVQSESG